MKNQTVFSSISQRVLYAYLFSFSDFKPIKNEGISETSQESLHTFMRRILEKVYEKPELLSLPLDTDWAYPINVCNNQFPEVDKIYQSVFKTLYEFYHFLYKSAFYGEVRNNAIIVNRELLKQHKASYKTIFLPLLNDLEIEVKNDKEKTTLFYDGKEEIFPAMKLLACQNTGEYEQYRTYPPMNYHHNLFLFAACSFDGNCNYLIDRLDQVYQLDSMCKNLEKECLNKGYHFTCKCGITGTDYFFSVILQKNVGGFLFSYNPRKEWKLSFGTLNGIGEKAMLEDFASLDEDMKEYFLHICKPCNNCLGCTKKGRNEVYTVKVTCLNSKLIKVLLKYHDLQDKYSK